MKFTLKGFTEGAGYGLLIASFGWLYHMGTATALPLFVAGVLTVWTAKKL